ncbi:MAG: winged helix DNA-binding protein [Clostridiales bacterium]|jgi:DNA-binding MarR family transcriptional regulator|nr:winged helix DNA-binding protein [Clostridiales bacterium]
MDYSELAFELLNTMQSFYRAAPQKYINEALQGEAFVLHYISLYGDDVQPGAISHKMDVSSARMAAALNNLENKGFITRQTDLSDRRKVLIRLTPAGKEQAAKNTQKVMEAITQMLQFLGEQDAGEYIRIMGRLSQMHLNNGKEIILDEEKI